MNANPETPDLTFAQKVMQAFGEVSETQILKKGDYLLQEGQVEKNLYFIEKGAIKLFYLSEYEERIIRFGYDGSIINSMSSFFNQQPSEFYIEAIKQTKVKVLSKEKLLALVHENQESLAQYCKFLETQLAQQIDREIDLLITSPAQRLERVLQRSPHLFQHIPLKYIASYLRMNPETLSRIRNS